MGGPNTKNWVSQIQKNWVSKTQNLVGKKTVRAEKLGWLINWVDQTQKLGGPVPAGPPVASSQHCFARIEMFLF